MADVATLIEALPYIREFRGKTFVLRCAATFTDEELKAICRDIAILRYVGVKAVIVHPHDAPPRDAVAETRPRLTHRLVHGIGEFGPATGLSGSDGAPRWLLSTTSENQIVANADLVRHVLDDYTPVVEAVAVGPTGDTVVVDPDMAAAKLAVSLNAYRLLLIVGDHRVIIEDEDGPGEVSEMRATPDVLERIDVDPEISPALDAAVSAVVSNEVQFAHLIPAHEPHAVLLELFTDRGFGTKIRSGLEWAASSDLPESGYWCWPRDGSGQASVGGVA